MTIDPLDARLIATLRANPRIGLLEVARQLGVARGTVQARLAKLEARGVVTGDGPAEHPGDTGYPTSAFLLRGARGDHGARARGRPVGDGLPLLGVHGRRAGAGAARRGGGGSRCAAGG